MTNIFYKITGGRPMQFQGYAFCDTVSGESVNRYIDKFGRCWLATNKWATFRVAVK